jgi:hypothetical protein
MKPNIPAVISSSSKIARKIAYWKLKRASLILQSCLLYRDIIDAVVSLKLMNLVTQNI